jgi:hypothetical protein
MTRAQQAELEWAIRNRASLTKEQRAKYRAMWDEAYPAAPKRGKARSPEEEIRHRNRATQPSDLDPLDAAAAPIATESVAGPVRKRSRADAAVDRSMSGSMYSPSEIVDSMDVTDMPTREDLDMAMGIQAGGSMRPTGMPDADPRTTRAERLAQSDRWAADVDRRAAEYNRDTGMPQPSGLAGNDGYRDWGGWQPGDPVPERPRMGPTALESARESQATDRNAAIGSKYGPIAQRIAEAGDAAGVTDYDAVKSPQERQMNTYRRAIEQEARFGTDTESRDRARETLATLEKSRALDNIAFRDKVANAPGAQDRRDKEQSRLERWQAISMLAGGSPSRQQVAMGNAFLNMPSDWQNAVSAKALRPDMDGTTPLTVDANSAKNAMRMMNAEMFAGGMPGMMQEREAARKQKQRADAFAWAQAERNRLHWNDSAPMTMQDANRLRRKVAALFGPEYADVVDALGVEDGAAPRTPPNPTGGAI